MRSEERKGAWLLLIGVLVFGALLWGLGGRYARGGSVEDDVKTEMTVLSSGPDSISVKDTTIVEQRLKGRRSKKTKHRKAERKYVQDTPVRDLLSDTIKSLSEG